MSNSYFILGHTLEGFMIENELQQLVSKNDDGFSCDVFQSMESLASNYDDYPDALAAQKVYKVHVTIVEMVKDAEPE